MNTARALTAGRRLSRTTTPRLQHHYQQTTHLNLKSPFASSLLPFRVTPRHRSPLSSKHVNRRYSTRPDSTTKPKSPPSNTETPVFDFNSLGIKGPVKVVVIAVICVLSTIETVFWIKVGWRWWNGGEDGQGMGSDQVEDVRSDDGGSEGDSAGKP